MNGHLSETGDLIKGILRYSDHLKDASSTLEKIAKVLEKDPESCEVSADTHMIMITGPDAIIDELVAQELAEIAEYDEEDYDEDYCEEDDYEEDED